MTIVVVILLGAGVLLIASAIDDVSILTTFQTIIKGDAVGTTADITPAPGATTTPPPTTLV